MVEIENHHPKFILEKSEQRIATRATVPLQRHHCLTHISTIFYWGEEPQTCTYSVSLELVMTNLSMYTIPMPGGAVHLMAPE